MPVWKARLPSLEMTAWLLAAAGMLFALGFRLSSNPAGLSSDDVSVGLNARAIWRTGTDQYGTSFPLYFRALDDWKSPIGLYVAAFTTALFGNDAVGVRAPSVLFVILTAALLWWCVRELTGRAALARWMALFSLQVPVVFLYGRLALVETSSLLALLMLGIAGVIAFSKRPTVRRAAVAGALLGLATYTYAAARLLMPLAVATATAAFLLDRETRKKVWPLPAAAAIVALPLAIFMLIHRGVLVARLNTMSVFGGGRTHLAGLKLFVENYFSHFAPDYLFRVGQQHHSHWHNFETGFLSLWMWIPLVLSFPYFWKRRREPFPLFLAVLVLLSSIPDSLTTDDVPHPNRWAFVAPVLVLICALVVADWLETAKPSRLVVGTLIAAVLFDGGLTLRKYFVDYPKVFEQDNGGGLDDGKGMALQIAFADRHGRPMYLPPAFMDQALLGFWGDLDPKKLREGGPRAFGIFDGERAPHDQVISGSIWIAGGDDRPPFPADRLGSIDRHYTQGTPYWVIYRKR
ncbi:MAG TPA: glycosyltransferase family 39 protein [Myxococcales bacterium]|nr:glycosyltransferase family 39 protein [Myxococcales bacterium]